jgi:hypothetical protein
MNWTQEWDYESNGNGWNDGRCGGLRSSSAVIVPCSAANFILRLIIVALVVAGFAGGAFQAYRCVRLVTQVVSQPNAVVAHSTRGAVSKSLDQQGSSSSRLTHHSHSTIR